MAHRFSDSSIACHILCCTGSSCKKRGAAEVLEMLKKELKEEGLHEYVHITKTHCNNLCEHSPILMVYPDGIWYKQMTPKRIKKLVQQHIRRGAPLKKYILRTIPY
ncbi:MAG: (2Fe-2S) ferredoxin domain-containing protein [Candidatus Kapabacteria bacterium]|nr:(2Fe-2S) ferredoxin domain-containing protein [Candidatus Kapabacteria bacterium]